MTQTLVDMGNVYRQRLKLHLEVTKHWYLGNKVKSCNGDSTQR